MGKTARNERRKLVATLFNGTAGATLATGTLSILHNPLGQIGLRTVVWAYVIAIRLHLVARLALLDMED